MAGGMRSRRGGLLAAGLGTVTLSAGLALAALIGPGSGAGPAGADALCDQMRAQYGPSWPCISVPTYTPPPTMDAPSPAPGAPGAPSGGGPVIGGDAGPGPGTGNGTPIVGGPTPESGDRGPGSPATQGPGPGPETPEAGNGPADRTDVPSVPGRTTPPGLPAVEPEVPERITEPDNRGDDMIPLPIWLLAGAAAVAAASPRGRSFLSRGGATRATVGPSRMVLIHDESSPTTYRFAMSVPEGGSTKINPDGSATVYDKDGNPVRQVAKPWAFDSAGRPQKTWYTVGENGDLIQHVEPDNDALFPILADPTALPPSSGNQIPWGPEHPDWDPKYDLGRPDVPESDPGDSWVGLSPGFGNQATPPAPAPQPEPPTDLPPAETPPVWVDPVPPTQEYVPQPPAPQVQQPPAEVPEIRTLPFNPDRDNPEIGALPNPDPDTEPPTRTAVLPAIVGGILRGGILRVLPPWLGSPINPRADKEEIERRHREKQEQEQAEREAKEELQRLLDGLTAQMGYGARGWADLTPEERQRELLLYHDYVNDLEARLDKIDDDGFKDRGKAVLNDFRDFLDDRQHDPTTPVPDAEPRQPGDVPGDNPPIGDPENPDGPVYPGTVEPDSPQPGLPDGEGQPQAPGETAPGNNDPTLPTTPQPGTDRPSTPGEPGLEPSPSDPAPIPPNPEPIAPDSDNPAEPF